MPTLVGWIEEEAEGEPIEGVVIGEMGWGDYGSERVSQYEEHPRGKVLSWEEAKMYLDYVFAAGYGAPGCEAVYAWTPSWVIAVSQHDGSTCPFRVPRNPVDCVPIMPGG